MVAFLLDNSLGAWWAARRLSDEDRRTATSEDALRQQAAIPGVPLEYLRFVRSEADVVRASSPESSGQDGLRTQPGIDAHQKRAERLLASRQLMLPFEERPVLGADLSALNRTRFERYHERRFRRPLTDSALSYERLLGNLKLAVQDDDNAWRPTNIGLLLFCDRPDQHLGGAYVDLAVYDHPVADGNTRDSKRVTGPVTE